jgi:hypothetical protein
VQPVNRSFGRILRHSFHFVVERPAVVAIQIAFEFREEIGDQWVEVAFRDPGTDIGKEPAAHRMVDLARFPMAFIGWMPIGISIDGGQQIRMLWKNRIWKSLRLPDWLQPRNRSLRFGQKAMQRDVEPEIRRLFSAFSNAHYTPKKIKK